MDEMPNNKPTVLPLVPATTVENWMDLAKDATPLEIRESGRVTIEIVGVCQAKCPYCAYNSGKSRRTEKPAAYMPIPMFKNLVSRVAKSQAFVNKKIDRIYLYNWGEPFLAPAINDYLEVLKEHGLYAVISSNFQKVPFIREENLPVINELIFSLSGMTQATYGRVHGGEIAKVLSDFEVFAGRMSKHAPRSKMFMAWHRYKFNEHEFWGAYAFSRKLGVGFIPSVAFLADLVELIEAAGGRLPQERRDSAERDLFFQHMVNTIGSYSKGGTDYACPFWDDVVVNERGQMLICCGTDSQSAIGSALSMSFDEMREKKIRSGMCRACKNLGVAEWSHNNHHARNQLPWPAGPRMDRLRLSLANNQWKIKNDVRNMLDNHALGGTILDVYRKLKHRSNPIAAGTSD